MKTHKDQLRRIQQSNPTHRSCSNPLNTLNAHAQCLTLSYKDNAAMVNPDHTNVAFGLGHLQQPWPVEQLHLSEHGIPTQTQHTQQYPHRRTDHHRHHQRHAADPTDCTGRAQPAETITPQTTKTTLDTPQIANIH